jgi:hypothetical protein
MSKSVSEFKRQFQETAKRTLTKKTQVGYGDQESKHREIGDRWTDLDGNEWEQKKGYRVKIKNTPDVGIFSKQCKDCDKNCSTEQKHKETYLRFDRCFHCQLNFEVDLKAKGKWEEWVMEQEKMRWEPVIKEMKEEMEKQKNNNPYDKSLANAIANSNVAGTIEKNKKMTGG